jgi:hypothetical protein
MGQRTAERECRKKKRSYIDLMNDVLSNGRREVLLNVHERHSRSLLGNTLLGGSHTIEKLHGVGIRCKRSLSSKSRKEKRCEKKTQFLVHDSSEHLKFSRQTILTLSSPQDSLEEVKPPVRDRKICAVAFLTALTPIVKTKQ